MSKPDLDRDFVSNTAAQVAGSLIVLALTSLWGWVLARKFEWELIPIVVSLVAAGLVSILVHGYVVSRIRQGSPLLQSVSKIERIVREKVRKRPKDNIIYSISTSVMHQVCYDFQSGGEDCLTFDRDYYKRSLEVINTHSNAKAIAHIGLGLEEFWLKDPSSHQYHVVERIFLVPWKWLFNEAQIMACLVMLKEHAGSSPNYKVLFGTGPIAARNNDSFSWSAGWNMLIADDVVLGYKIIEDKIQLKATWRAGEAAIAEKEYKTISDHHAIPVERSITRQQLLSRWFEKEGIGKWLPAFSTPDVAARGSEYLDKYDMHIRAWIPLYDEFIDYAAQRTIEYIDLLARSSQRSETRVLEIGFGTGALTKPILEWIKKDQLARPLNAANLGVKYYGIDRASDAMVKRMRNNIPEDLMRIAVFEQGEAWKEEAISPKIKMVGKFDVICGSLVLHDMVSGDVANKLETVIERSINYLHPDGKIVFADVCVEDDPGKRIAQRANWCAWMIRQGMSPQVAEQFLDSNKDMIDTVSEDLLTQVCRKHGLFLVIDNFGGDSPFKIISIHKTCPV